MARREVHRPILEKTADDCGATRASIRIASHRIPQLRTQVSVAFALESDNGAVVFGAEVFRRETQREQIHSLPCRAKIATKDIKCVQQFVKVGVVSKHSFQRITTASLRPAKEEVSGPNKSAREREG